MKNNYLKIICTLIMLLAICSVKAQSLQQKHQKDMDLRKKQVNEVLLKAKEQQVQQKSEGTNDAPQSSSAQSNIQVKPVQQQNEIKPKAVPPTETKRQLMIQKGAAKKGSTE